MVESQNYVGRWQGGISVARGGRARELASEPSILHHKLEISNFTTTLLCCACYFGVRARAGTELLQAKQQVLRQYRKEQRNATVPVVGLAGLLHVAGRNDKSFKFEIVCSEHAPPLQILVTVHLLGG